MKCPSCDNGNRGFPAHVAFAPGKRPKTEKELRTVCEALSKCDVCNGTGEVSDEQAVWIEAGKVLKAVRLKLGYGLRGAAVKLGMLEASPSLSDMERGKVKPDLTLLDRL